MAGVAALERDVRDDLGILGRVERDRDELELSRSTRSPHTPMSPWNVPQSTSATGLGRHGFQISTTQKPPFQVPW